MSPSILISDLTSRNLNQTVATERLVVFSGFCILALQRLSVPFGNGAIQVPILVLLATFFVLLVQGAVSVDPKRLVLLIWVGTMGAISLAIGNDTNPPWLAPSVLSLLLLLSVYMPALLVPSAAARGRALGHRFFTGLIYGVKLGVVLSLAQWILQKLGRGFIDPLTLLPSQFQTSGFNTQYDTQYILGGAKGVFKPNGMLFLEPSFLSMYAALGILYWICLLIAPSTARNRRQDVTRVSWVAVAGVSLAISASTTGVLILAIGLVFVVFFVRRNLMLIVLLCAAALGMLAVGLFDALVLKAQEGFIGNTSTALRLVTPYVELTPRWLEHPLLGWGPGSATAFAADTGMRGLQIPTVLKGLIEYGLLGVVPLTLLVFSAISRSTAPVPLLAGLLAAYLIPSEALLNASLVALLVFAAPFWQDQSSGPASKTALKRPFDRTAAATGLVR